MVPFVAVLSDDDVFMYSDGYRTRWLECFKLEIALLTPQRHKPEIVVISTITRPTCGFSCRRRLIPKNSMFFGFIQKLKI